MGAVTPAMAITSPAAHVGRAANLAPVSASKPVIRTVLAPAGALTGASPLSGLVGGLSGLPGAGGAAGLVGGETGITDETSGQAVGGTLNGLTANLPNLTPGTGAAASSLSPATAAMSGLSAVTGDVPGLGSATGDLSGLVH